MVGLPETDGQGKILSDAWDYKGRPAVRSQSGGWASAAMILVVELVERLTTLGIAVNLVTYLTGTMHLGNAEAANAVTNFLGTSFMFCLLGGFIADTFLGRYLTIAIFATIQAAGVTILTISTTAPGLRPPPCVNSSNATTSGGGSNCARGSAMQLGMLYAALYLTALGTGGLKSSVSGFGSDQFDDRDPREKSLMIRFFNWFFFFISLGSLLAVTVLVYVQDELGRRWGYRFKKLVGSPLTQFAAVAIAAWRKRRLELPSDPAMLYDVDAVAAAATGEEKGAGGRSKGKQKLPHTKQF
ncbi:Protein NRT1/ PTR FAMILY 6.3, partial [Ananas comosus]